MCTLWTTPRSTVHRSAHEILGGSGHHNILKRGFRLTGQLSFKELRAWSLSWKVQSLQTILLSEFASSVWKCDSDRCLTSFTMSQTIELVLLVQARQGVHTDSRHS